MKDATVGGSKSATKKKPKENVMISKEKPYHGLKKGDQYYKRTIGKAPVQPQLEQNMEVLIKARNRFIWELSDVQKQLEQLTYDEKAILERSLPTKEQWEIKKKIKSTFIKEGIAPDTELLFYKVGSLIGKGSFGKVNMGLHKLTRQMVAIKSINKVMKESAQHVNMDSSRKN